MVYLDYSATTPVDRRVLESFERTSLEYIGNPNSLHLEGVKAKKLMDAATHQVASLLSVYDSEVIFTSGATEANNMAIMGVVNKYLDRGKTIITTKLEHASILEPLKYLKSKGYNIQYVKVNKDGLVDLKELERMLNDDVLLVSIGEVNSEIGIVQNVDEIGQLLKKYPRIIYHVDGTQAVGKKKVNLENIDLYSFSGHKIYGLKGIGCLIKKEHIVLEPLLHGGKSQTVYRAGTPPLALIVSLAKALKLILNELDNNEKYVYELNQRLINGLRKIDGVRINSNEFCLPHIVNISVLKSKPETVLHSLEEDEIYISTKTACSTNDNLSLSVLELTKDEERAKSSIRISISHLTKSNEIDFFLEKIAYHIDKLPGVIK